MLDLETVKRTKRASWEERLEIIGLIMQSLKNDLKSEPGIHKSQSKHVKVRQFNSGMEVNMACDELYSDRTL